jgi:16S rRNA (cytidine1402-2'-O)-methyltransferase
MASTLYVIATPIGNLEDVTLRALRILNEVDLILCEDTRVTKRLLSHYGIPTPTMSYHAHTTSSKASKILDLLRDGKNIALVSDAGTPAISDPGSLLVSQVLASGLSVSVVSIPGPSAVTAAISIAGFPVSDFLFLGFLPHKKGRETLFKEIAASSRTVVFYESPHRILKALSSLVSALPESRVVAVSRELTKIHEEVVRGSAPQVLAYFKEHPDKVRGEFVVTVGDQMVQS